MTDITTRNFWIISSCFDHDLSKIRNWNLYWLIQILKYSKIPNFTNIGNIGLFTQCKTVFGSQKKYNNYKITRFLPFFSLLFLDKIDFRATESSNKKHENIISRRQRNYFRFVFSLVKRIISFKAIYSVDSPNE